MKKRQAELEKSIEEKRSFEEIREEVEKELEGQGHVQTRSTAIPLELLAVFGKIQSVSSSVPDDGIPLAPVDMYFRKCENRVRWSWAWRLPNNFATRQSLRENPGEKLPLPTANNNIYHPLLVSNPRRRKRRSLQCQGWNQLNFLGQWTWIVGAPTFLFLFLLREGTFLLKCRPNCILTKTLECRVQQHCIITMPIPIDCHRKLIVFFRGT